MKKIREIIEEHTDWDWDSIDYDKIAAEIVGEVEKMMKDYPQIHSLFVDPDDWQAFKKTNGVE